MKPDVWRPVPGDKREKRRQSFPKHWKPPANQCFPIHLGYVLCVSILSVLVAAVQKVVGVALLYTRWGELLSLMMMMMMMMMMGSFCCFAEWRIQYREPCDEDLWLLLFDQNRMTYHHFFYKQLRIKIEIKTLLQKSATYNLKHTLVLRQITQNKLVFETISRIWDDLTSNCLTEKIQVPGTSITSSHLF